MVRGGLWDSRVWRFCEHAVRVTEPQPSLQVPDGKPFCHELPFVSVAGEAIGSRGRAGYWNDVLHTHQPQSVPALDVVECFRMLDVEVAVNQILIDVLEPLSGHVAFVDVAVGLRLINVVVL